MTQLICHVSAGFWLNNIVHVMTRAPIQYKLDRSDDAIV